MMKKILSLIFAIAALHIANAQDIYNEKDGKATFFSEAPIENIDAHNDSVVSALNVTTREVVFIIYMREFQFKKKLMQEHFNEKYVHSDKFPKSQFKGKILDEVDLKKDGTYEVWVEGELTIHNVTKHRKEKTTLTVKDGKIWGKTEFKIKVADHNIEVPTLLIKNIAEEVLVKIEVVYELKK